MAASCGSGPPSPAPPHLPGTPAPRRKVFDEVVASSDELVGGQLTRLLERRFLCEGNGSQRRRGESQTAPSGTARGVCARGKRGAEGLRAGAAGSTAAFQPTSLTAYGNAGGAYADSGHRFGQTVAADWKPSSLSTNFWNSLLDIDEWSKASTSKFRQIALSLIIKVDFAVLRFVDLM
jgi:hypothetical protein